MSLIAVPRSVIPACDVDSLEKLGEIVRATWDLPGIGGYKIGLELVIQHGAAAVVNTILENISASDDQDFPQLPIIYDHQKGATDIPELGAKFAQVLGYVGIDAVILFPFGGIVTLKEWIKACREKDLHVIVGGHMTHKGFLKSDGGFIADDGPARIYEAAANEGVRNFVVPGNQAPLVAQYRQLLERLLGDEFTLFAPGFINQGGNISETGKAAGERWHAIVGSAIYTKSTVEEMREVACLLTQQIL